MREQRLHGGTCVAPSCNDHLLNEGASDVDCGGGVDLGPLMSIDLPDIFLLKVSH